MKRTLIMSFLIALPVLFGAGHAGAQGGLPYLTPAPQFVPVPPAAPPAPVPSVVTPSPPLPGVRLNSGPTYYPPSSSTIRGSVRSKSDIIATRCVKWRGGKCQKRAAY